MTLDKPLLVDDDKIVSSKAILRTKNAPELLTAGVAEGVTKKGERNLKFKDNETANMVLATIENKNITDYVGIFYREDQIQLAKIKKIKALSPRHGTDFFRFGEKYSIIDRQNQAATHAETREPNSADAILSAPEFGVEETQKNSINRKEISRGNVLQRWFRRGKVYMQQVSVKFADPQALEKLEKKTKKLGELLQEYDKSLGPVQKKYAKQLLARKENLLETSDRSRLAVNPVDGKIFQPVLSVIESQVSEPAAVVSPGSQQVHQGEAEAEIKEKKINEYIQIVHHEKPASEQDQIRESMRNHHSAQYAAHWRERETQIRDAKIEEYITMAYAEKPAFEQARIRASMKNPHSTQHDTHWGLQANLSLTSRKLNKANPTFESQDAPPRPSRVNPSGVHR